MRPILRLTPEERVAGFPGPVFDEPYDSVSTTLSPRAALESLIADAVTAAPCYVMFSGGRDSSAVLAVALSVARAVGAPDPIPVTARHAKVADSLETEWQQAVLDHLGLRNQIVVDFDGEQSWLGETAVGRLRKFGLMWPVAGTIHGALLDRLDPGTVLSGEGGDMVIAGRRATTFLNAVRSRRPRLAVHEARLLVREPGELRRALTESRDAIAWLTPAGKELITPLGLPAVESLHWSKGLREAVASRPARMVRNNFMAAVESSGHRSSNPLEHPLFVSALMRAGGWRGFGHRTAFMKYLFGDVLPDAVLSRTTKAEFTGARWTDRERDFARSWDGAGVDPRYIDAEALRADWLSENPSPRSDFHLHAAWLAQNNLPAEGEAA